MAAAIHSYLLEVAEEARCEGDRRVRRQARVLAGKPIDVYEGHLRSFLNPWRTSFGTGHHPDPQPGEGWPDVDDQEHQQEAKKKRKR
ncbi:hypothetical protein AB0K34_37200 [Actinomadura sp. NPDC049382]|uniref:hypothetical protein n=1 Tax=Actinomadura sp. NPDC049382 TaxID=3158220 RepID=UPI00341EC4F6